MSYLSQLFADIPGLLLRIPIIHIALTVHECAHGWVANRCGDPTAKNLGRLSLNPLKHLDPFGTICMFLVGFGWARPVPINTRNFRNPKRGMALSALAGPVSNILLAFLGLLCYRLALAGMVGTGVLQEYGMQYYVTSDSNFVYQLINYTLIFFNLFCQLNLSLGIFNLIPIPPLDGSRILTLFLPPRLYFGLMRYENYIGLIWMVLLVSGIVTLPLGWLTAQVYNGMSTLLDWLLWFL